MLLKKARVQSNVRDAKNRAKHFFGFSSNPSIAKGPVMESNNALKAKTLALMVAIGVGSAATAVRADELQDLKRQLELLQKKVGELEMKQETAQKKQAAAVPDNVVTGGATKGSFKLPGSNTSVTLGGYVKLDAVYINPSSGVETTAELFLQPNAIAVGPGAGDNERNPTGVTNFFCATSMTEFQRVRSRTG